MKKVNGMSLIVLIICIVIIIAIAVLAINFILKETKERKIENLTTDMLLIQGKIKVISQENEMNKDENPLIGKKVSDNKTEENVKILLENKVILEEELEQYYIISSEELNKFNIKSEISQQFYIVNYKTYEVIYTQGIEINGKTHYKLSELLEYRNNIEQTVNTSNEEG